MRTAGFVLVGGLSTRMGQDKALLSMDSRPLVADVARDVAVATGSAVLIGSPERYGHLGFECLPDLRPGLGPLAGIEAALASSRGDLNLVVACDMPGLTAPFLEKLLRRAVETGALSVVTRDTTGVVHPLCAVYRTTCLPVVQRALDRRRLRLKDMVEELQAIPFDIDEIVWNVNTPQEWSAWREQQFLSKGASPRAANGA